MRKLYKNLITNNQKVIPIRPPGDDNDELYNSIKQQIINYSIGIIKFRGRGRTEDAILIGSGTLVSIGDNFGILTAEHVIDAFPNDGTIGLVLSQQVHQFTLDTQTLIKVCLGRGQNELEGPDLGFIKLPDTCLGTLKAINSFYNLDAERNDGILESPPANNLGVWCICGIPDEETEREGPSSGFRHVNKFLHICGFGAVSNEYSSGDFDYFDFGVYYDKGRELPVSFGGISGGSLWQNIIEKKSDSKLCLKRHILSGVVFYQSDLIDNKRIIKCHGRRSIYDCVFSSVISKSF